LVALVEKLFPAGWSAGRRKQVVHIDHAPSDNSGMTQNFVGHNPLKRLPRPLYSHDIPPLDFYMFRKVKSAPIGQKIPDEIYFLERVIEILNGISDAELQCVFRSWVEHVERVIDAR
jgi:hypothetical protein